MDSKRECKHFEARIDGLDPIGYIRCYECGEYVQVYKVLNNWLDEMARIKEQFELNQLGKS